MVERTSGTTVKGKSRISKRKCVHPKSLALSGA
ncbi:MAG: hypothetical protein H6575_07585 [Lewinellaceae bacterium]|nr:hypothetical protein [Lewinellaceae bacterium]